MNLKRNRLVFLSVLCLLAWFSNSHAGTTQIKWYSYDEGFKVGRNEGKKIFINFYADWCRYCKKMDKYTFGNNDVKKILEENFVPVKVDGGSKTQLTLGKEKITEKQLALRFGMTAFPTTLFLKPTGEKIPWNYNPVRGYIGAEIFSDVLNYLKDDLYKKVSFKDYLIKKEQDKKEKK